jgi:hypothetical protein
MRSGFEGCVNAAEDFDANQSDKIVETTSRLSVAFKAMPEPDDSLSFEGDEDRFDKVPAETRRCDFDLRLPSCSSTVPVMPMIFPWSVAIRWSVAMFEPAAMNPANVCLGYLVRN